MNQSNPFVFKNIHLVPILHNRLEFALEVHRRFTDLRPAAVAVELPPTLQDKILAAAKRLPYLSVVVYPEKSGRTVYLPIEPVDGIIEAVRLALEHSLPVFFVDRDTEGYPLFRDPLPDPYAVTQIGYEAYCRAYWEERGSETPTPDDLLRERTMASQALDLGRRYPRVLLVCGLSHFSGIRRQLDLEPARPLGRQTRSGVVLGNLNEDSSREILSEMPFLQGRYEEERTRARATGDPDDFWNLDRLRLRDELLSEAQRQHYKNSREKIDGAGPGRVKKIRPQLCLYPGGLDPGFLPAPGGRPRGGQR